MIPAPVQILIGKAQEQLRTLPAASVHQCITSPPYWALRDYGVEGQLGLEPTPEQYIADLVAVFDDVGRVLRDDGTLWVNLGDTYAQSGKQGGKSGAKNSQDGVLQARRGKRHDQATAGNQLLMPHRFALAMQAAGWVLRSTIVWHKRSPMPESQTGQRWVRCRVKLTNHQRENGYSNTMPGKPQSDSRHTGPYEKAAYQECPGCTKCAANDGYILRRGKWRPTTAHEYIFLFTRPGDYFCDGDASQEPCTGNAHARGDGLNPKARSIDAGDHRGARSKQNNSFSAAVNGLVETRNMRSVWTLSSEPCKEAHFATFPSELVRRCMLAATSAGGCCPECGSQYAPVVRSERVATRPGNDSKVGRASSHKNSPANRHHGDVIGNRDPQRHTTRTVIDDYRPTCVCKAGAAVPCVVLDPFGGAGTTAQTASWYGRASILCELNPDYAAIIAKRVETPPRCLLREQKKTTKRRRIDATAQLFMFDERSVLPLDHPSIAKVHS